VADQSSAPPMHGHRVWRVSHADRERLKAARNARSRSGGESRTADQPGRGPGDTARTNPSDAGTQAVASPCSHAVAFPTIPRPHAEPNTGSVANSCSHAGTYPTSSAAAEPHDWKRGLTT
jgi:hypothetical protein